MEGRSDGRAWLPELRLASLVGVPRSTYHAWEAEGLLERAANGACTEVHLVEAILCDAVRAEVSLAATKQAMRRFREAGVVQLVVDLLRGTDTCTLIDVVVEPVLGDVTLCFAEREVLQAVRDPARARTSTVVPLAEILVRAIRGFDNNATDRLPPEKRRRGRPPKSVSVTPLRRVG
jgi:hypothetical protein